MSPPRGSAATKHTSLFTPLIGNSASSLQPSNSAHQELSCFAPAACAFVVGDHGFLLTRVIRVWVRASCEHPCACEEPSCSCHHTRARSWVGGWGVGVWLIRRRIAHRLQIQLPTIVPNPDPRALRGRTLHHHFNAHCAQLQDSASQLSKCSDVPYDCGSSTAVFGSCLCRSAAPSLTPHTAARNDAVQ